MNKEDATNEGIKRLMAANCGQIRLDYATVARAVRYLHLGLRKTDNARESHFASAHFVSRENLDCR